MVYRLKVCDATPQKAVTISGDTLMSELWVILNSNRVSGTPVVDGEKLIGIISFEDLIKWLSGSEDDCPVATKMTMSVKTVFSDEPLIHAISQLERTGFSRIPVIDRISGKLFGIITKGDVIERLLRRLEIEYHEEEIHRYRASHIFEDIIGDKVSLQFQSRVIGKDFNCAGEASSGLKKTLERLCIHPKIVRRAAIASYEAEMNLVIYTDGGTITTTVKPNKLSIDVEDDGPGIADIEKAMQSGYSTASEWVRQLGFGAGMGLVNIKGCADKMELASTVGKGTHLKIHINFNNTQTQTKAG